MDLIPDRPARDAAETTFDRNVVVVAGAGTGKTTLLVNRLVHALMKEPEPVAITQVVALTFTNKAATEMKVRLRERLMVLAHPGVSHAPDGGAVSVDELVRRYSLDEAEIARRAAAALRDVEKAQIGTLHSFAAHLLRLHPLEGGVDPAFREDDGLRFEEQFSTAWDVWLDQELSQSGTQHGMWRHILGRATLDQLRSMARALCSELVDLDELNRQLDDDGIPQPMAAWIRSCRDKAQRLLVQQDRPKRRKIEHMLAASCRLFERLEQDGLAGMLGLSAEEHDWLRKDPGGVVGGWEKSAFREAVSSIRIAVQLLDVDRSFFKHLLRLIVPLVCEVRRSFAVQGWVSFDGLLARARALLRDHPPVRERIKRDYRAVLVDEFQDTDPIQYEIILSVAERQGRHARDWQELVLEPGKLFIVGDPKQSIYAFRRADIEAFDRIVSKIETDGGLVSTLTTNFRSDAAVLGPVNDVFDRLFERQPLVQPANVRLDVRPNRRVSQLTAGVRLQIMTPGEEGEALDSAAACRAESESLARWIAAELAQHPPLRAGQIAMLFRKLTQADTYLDALRRHGIPYVIEGEKHFYRRQEVIDIVNLLRVLDHPHDTVALAGLLRSPLGGLTDRELFEVFQAGCTNYLDAPAVDAWHHPRAGQLRRLYDVLAGLHQEVGRCPLGDAVQRVFDRLPVLELAGASLHGEQAVANLLKVKHTATGLSDRPHLTLSAFVELMVTRLDEQPDEAESPLSEEASDAVQILTIHKAKGLEFPVVILPGLHQGSGRERALPSVTYDWSSGLYGLALGAQHTLGSVVVHEKFRVREEAERRRVFYVGMTRAKDLLLLSGALTARSSGETVLDWLGDIVEGDVGGPATNALTVGTSTIPQLVMQAPDYHWPRRRPAPSIQAGSADGEALAALWTERRDRWTVACATPIFLTPSTMDRGVTQTDTRTAFSGEPEVAKLVGIAAHRILERWDFSADPQGLLDQVVPVVRSVAATSDGGLSTAVEGALGELLMVFGQSPLYPLLRTATILGREVPCLLPWGDGQVMNGVIDVLFRHEGRLWIGDYKTDAVAADEAPHRAERYRAQAAVYQAAVAQSLGESDVSCMLLFLRAGVSVTV